MMDTLQVKRKKPRHRSNARKNSSLMLFLPEELLAEILPFFNVKIIMRMKCLSKSWLAFISDSNFTLKHLKKSSQNPHLTLFWRQAYSSFNVVTFPVYCILKTPSINICKSPDIQSIYCWDLVGSCNGLLCLNWFYTTYEFRLWNLATRTTSKKFGLLSYGNPYLGFFNFTFGYDASTSDYKVVAFHANENEGSWKSEVKVFSVGDNCWRIIQSFPAVVLFNWVDRQYLTDGVHFSGTVNWLAVDMSIVSLYLSTETYKQFLLPRGFDNMSFSQPVLRVLMDCLCFSYDSKKTEFVNGDMVIFANKSRKQRRDQAFIYNLKDKTVERIKCRNSIQWFDNAKDYVESLVSVC